MFCKECGNEVGDRADVCVVCGVSVYRHNYNPEAREKNIYVLLGILLGFFGVPGIHNFYAGYHSKGLLQLLLTIFSCYLLWLPIYIWNIVEIATVNEDADGIAFR